MTQLDQDFIKACESAAKLRPDDIHIFEGAVYLPNNPDDEGMMLDAPTQDDIDRMAEAVGRRIYVCPTWYDGIPTEKCAALIVQIDAREMNRNLPETFDDQLSAKKAGFVAIVKELEK